MSYAVFFDKNNETIRLPVNPENIKIEKGIANETYSVLKLGKVILPSETELEKYTFEAELPSKMYNYVLTKNNFKPASFYIKKIGEWMQLHEPIRFIINNSQGEDLSKLVLIEEFGLSEKAGEEGDYIAGFKLVEYKPYKKKEVVIMKQQNYLSSKNMTKIKQTNREGKPSIPKTYTVMNGDTLWGIAKRFFGDGSKFTEIVKLNPSIKNPALIRVGQVIRLS